MNRRRLFITGALTLTLGFAVWTMAISFTPVASSFASGDEVSASTFNQLFNDINSNFSAAAAEFDNKVSTAGDSMTGALLIEGDTGTADAALKVKNTNPDGVSAYVEANSTESALNVKNTGTGPLIRALNSNLGGLLVANDGSLTISADGRSNTISLDAVSGDVTISGSVKNKSGKALTPIAHGMVGSTGTVHTGSGNIAVTQTGTGSYEVDITGTTYHYQKFVTVATPVGGTAEVLSTNNNLLVLTYDHSGNPSNTDFNFVTYKP